MIEGILEINVVKVQIITTSAQTADGIKNWTTIEIKCLFWAENMTVVEYCMSYIILKAWFVVKPEEGVRTRFLNKPEWGQLKPGG